MATSDHASRQSSDQVSDLFDALDVTKAIDTGEFRIFLDHIPIAIIISKGIEGVQRIGFVNKAYDASIGQPGAEIIARRWSTLDGFTLEDTLHRPFSEMISAGEDFTGTFRREQPKPV